MRIVSLLPSATEIVADLGLIGHLVGRSHECNWPESVRKIPAVSASRIDSASLDGQQIDDAVREATEKGEALYAVDAGLLAELRPDVILTQDLCHVCAVSGSDFASAGSKVISLGPKNLADVADSVRTLGRELGAAERGESLAEEMMQRIDRVRRAVGSRKRPRVFVAEWIDPPYASGHWIPEMVEAAGGVEVLGRAGQRSVRTTWETVISARPDMVIAAPCGFDEERSAREARSIPLDCRIVPVDADRYFVRPAPSLARGVEILAGIFHRIDAEQI